MAIAVKESENLYLKNFREFEKQQSAAPAWLKELRTEGIRTFADLGFPTTRIEDWKYTNITPITSVQFEPASYEYNSEVARKFENSAFQNLGCSRLVFVNGHFSRELSWIEDLPKGVKVLSLSQALTNGAGALENHLGRYAGFKNHAFVALNTAFLEDGGYIEIPKGVVLEKPIHLVYLASGNANRWVSHPRNLILAGRESQASIVESYLGLDGGVYLTNAVTELATEENARVEYVKIQRESAAAFHVATVLSHIARNASVVTNSIQFGARLGREEATTVLDGEGAESYLYGLYVTNGQQLIDNHTTIDHAKPHCASREFYKGVLDGKSTGVFNGKILVRKDAQKTDSKQSDKNLLLSEFATINTKPQLEIFADDVKCTHGATIGQIDPDAIFYLRSRGIALQDARQLLTAAFANDIIDRVKFQPLRERLKAILTAKMAGNEQ